MAGYQNTSEVLIDKGKNGMYWSSSQKTINNAYNLYFNNTIVSSIDFEIQTNALSIRCIKD